MGRGPQRSEVPRAGRGEEPAWAQGPPGGGGGSGPPCAQRLRASGRLSEECSVWPELRRKDTFFDRPRLGGRGRKSDFPAVGNSASKGLETGNCKTCPSALAGRLHQAMQWDLGQDCPRRCLWGTLACVWRHPAPFEAFKERRKVRASKLRSKPYSCNNSVLQ